MCALSTYEQEALRQIEVWKNPPQSWFEKQISRVSGPIEDITAWAMDSRVGDAIGTAVGKASQGILGVLNDSASWTVRHEQVFAKFRAAGHDQVNAHDDIFTLDLQHVDSVVGYLNAQYVALGGAEGALAGYVGLPGLVADVPAIFAINLRAIADYATHYGFDVTNQVERAFILNVLNYSLSPTAAAKQVVLADLIKLSRAVAAKQAWKHLNQYAGAAAMKKVGEAVGIRVTKAKLGQAIPVAGAVVGGGFNAWFTRTNCDAAFHLYRERFLNQRLSGNTQ